MSATPGGRSSTRPHTSVVSKTSTAITSCVEKKGRTLFLLKKSSKPVPQKRSRVKLSVYGEEELKQEEMANMSDVRQNMSESQHMVSTGMTNVIGNVEDRPQSATFA